MRWCVKNARSVIAIFDTEAEAIAKRKELNKQYQTNEYIVEQWRGAKN